MRSRYEFTGDDVIAALREYVQRRTGSVKNLPADPTQWTIQHEGAPLVSLADTGEVTLTVVTEVD